MSQCGKQWKWPQKKDEIFYRDPEIIMSIDEPIQRTMDDLVRCPDVPTHVVKKSKLGNHILKCRIRRGVQTPAPPPEGNATIYRKRRSNFSLSGSIRQWHLAEASGTAGSTSRTWQITGCGATKLRGGVTNSRSIFRGVVDELFVKGYLREEEERKLFYELNNGEYGGRSRADYVLKMSELAAFLYESIDEKDLVIPVAMRDTYLRYFTSNAQSASSNANVDLSTLNINPSSNAKFPTLELPKFYGDYDKWGQFRDMFLSLVDKDRTLENTKKFYYLVSCLKGEAVKVIANVEITNENYHVAWDLLQNRYENSSVIIKKHVRELFEMSSASNESHSLRQLTDNLQKHLRSLASLGKPVESWSTLLIYLITKKLDFASKGAWEEYEGNATIYRKRRSNFSLSGSIRQWHLAEASGTAGSTSRTWQITGCGATKLRGGVTNSRSIFRGVVDELFVKGYLREEEERKLFYELNNGEYGGRSRADYVLKMSELAAFLYESIDEKDLVIPVAMRDTYLRYFTSNAQSASSNANVDLSTLNINPSSNAKFPTLELPKFYGDYDKWGQFRDMFLSLVDKDRTLENTKKFYYLVSCLKGEAVKVIANVEITNENYHVAWDLLKNRYENSSVIIKKHVRELFEMSSASNESHSLRQLTDNLQKHLRSLASLGKPVESWSTLLIYLITKKLDFASKGAWEEYAIYTVLYSQLSKYGFNLRKWPSNAPNIFPGSHCGTEHYYLTFVANRIAEIQSITNNENWYHVNSSNNPADLISRGLYPSDIMENKLWWYGAQHLLQPQSNWPMSVFNPEKNIPEIKTCVTTSTTMPEFDIFCRHSSFSTFQRVMAYICIFIHNVKHPQNKYSGYLSVVKLDNALNALIKLARNKQPNL
nr:unnamed protein product [Callosobruchus analis]